MRGLVKYVSGMNDANRRILFLLFFLSGLASLVYQIIWTRMAFAAFGIITPVLSIVLSVFMFGLALGSWTAGRFVATWVRKTGMPAIFFYACAEMTIALGAFAVPHLFAAGERMLLNSGQTNSFAYLSLSALVLAVSILPWCVCMGMTFPLMMAFVRQRNQSSTSFSFLYLSNVLGAMCGIFFAVIIWIEKFGFHHTLWIAAAGNVTAALVALVLAWWYGREALPPENLNPATTTARGVHTGSPAMAKWILFSTGFIAMAIEVVWTRAFTPILRTEVYSFASIVFTYLGATFAGSCLYRWHLQKDRLFTGAILLPGLVIAALLPVIVNNPFALTDHFGSRLAPWPAVVLLASICPFCALLGYLTPGLVDRYAAGNPTAAGKAYAINVLGCILGPLFAGYCLLPFMNERYALIGLTLPLVAFWIAMFRQPPVLVRAAFTIIIAGATIAAGSANDFETSIRKHFPQAEIRRDYAASVLSFDSSWRRRLLINGIGMTQLTPITKFMAHLPMAIHQGRPKSVLVICFGMGTSFRSALSWNVDTTAVELIPDVPRAFGYYYDNAAEVLANPNGTVIIDDGRRYLDRCGKKFDIIIVDPPPPIEAAGSSLLFSKEFYAVARQHLNPNGILQMWYPGGDPATGRAVLRSAYESFPHVRCYVGVSGWGDHLIASEEPLDVPDPQTLADRMPEAAQKDLVEWCPTMKVPDYLRAVLTNEVSLPQNMDPDPGIKITDDHPINEYYLLRRAAQK